MASMSPILRIRSAFRSFGVNSEQADEVVSAVDEYYLSRQAFEERIARLMAEQRNQFLFGVLIVVLDQGVFTLLLQQDDPCWRRLTPIRRARAHRNATSERRPVLACPALDAGTRGPVRPGSCAT